MKNILIDGAVKLLLLIVVAGRLVSPSNTAALSNKEPARTPGLSQHDNQ